METTTISPAGLLLPLGILIVVIVIIQLAISRLMKAGCAAMMARLLATVGIIALAINLVKENPSVLASSGSTSGFQQTSSDINASASVEAETVVTTGNLNASVTGTGTVSAIRQVALMFETSAPVAEVLVQEGQSVQAGEVLARLDADDLETALQDAEIAYQQAQVDFNTVVDPARDVEVAVAEAELAQAQAEADAVNVGVGPEEAEIARLQTELARNSLWQAQLNAADTLAPEFRGRDATMQDVQTESNLRQQELNVDIADAGYQSTLDSGPSASSLASASAQVLQAQVNLDELRAGANFFEAQQAALDLEVARLEVERARINLQSAELIAPFAGIIGRNNLLAGEVPPDDTAIELIDTSAYYVDVSVDETDIVGINVGQSVNLQVDALPEAVVTGTVTRVAKTSTLLDDVVTYTVRVTLDPALVGLRVGMNTTAQITTIDLQDVVLVPNRFLTSISDGDRALVTVQNDDGTFETVPVEVGLRGASDTEIVSGLEPGQHVVLLAQTSNNLRQPGVGAIMRRAS